MSQQQFEAVAVTDCYDPVYQQEDEFITAGKAVRALSSPARLRIMCLLLDKERSVVELTRMIDHHTQSSISQHLSFLLKAGIVKNRKYKTQMLYRITDRRVFQLMVLTEELFCGCRTKPGN